MTRTRPWVSVLALSWCIALVGAAGCARAPCVSTRRGARGPPGLEGPQGPPGSRGPRFFTTRAPGNTTFVVPPRVENVTIQAWGGGGGGGGYRSGVAGGGGGGSGAALIWTIAVAAGDVLILEQGADAAGGSGGTSPTAPEPGNASRVFLNGVLIAVIGGGGGAGSGATNYLGGSGGTVPLPAGFSDSLFKTSGQAGESASPFLRFIGAPGGDAPLGGAGGAGGNDIARPGDGIEPGGGGGGGGLFPNNSTRGARGAQGRVFVYY